MSTDQYGLTQIAYVQPSANLNDLRHVIVVDRDIETIFDNEEGEAED